MSSRIHARRRRSEEPAAGTEPTSLAARRKGVDHRIDSVTTAGCASFETSSSYLVRTLSTYTCVCLYIPSKIISARAYTSIHGSPHGKGPEMYECTSRSHVGRRNRNKTCTLPPAGHHAHLPAACTRSAATYNGSRTRLVVSPKGSTEPCPGAAAVVDPPELRCRVQTLALRCDALLPGLGIPARGAVRSSCKYDPLLISAYGAKRVEPKS
jgi:hypothetical protein